MLGVVGVVGVVGVTGVSSMPLPPTIACRDMAEFAATKLTLRFLNHNTEARRRPICRGHGCVTTYDGSCRGDTKIGEVHRGGVGALWAIGVVHLHLHAINDGRCCVIGA